MKLQQRNGQYTLTLPKDLVIGFGWAKGTELAFQIIGKEELKIKKNDSQRS